MNYRAGQNVCALLGCHRRNEEKATEKETVNLGLGRRGKAGGWLSKEVCGVGWMYV